jgi:ligand-binding sensor domain-containing protein
VYAATFKGGVFKSIDGGESWQPISQGLRILDVRALVIDPQNTEILYAGVENGGVYKSFDSGDHWQRSNNGLDAQAAIRAIVVDPVDPTTLYAADFRTGVYHSENGGQLWTRINEGLSTRAVKAMAISSDGQVLYAATEGEGVFRLGEPPPGIVPAPAPTPKPKPKPQETVPPTTEGPTATGDSVIKFLPYLITGIVIAGIIGWVLWRRYFRSKAV